MIVKAFSVKGSHTSDLPDVSDSFACVPPDILHELIILFCWCWSLLNNVYINRKFNFSKRSDLCRHGCLGAQGRSDMDRNAIWALSHPPLPLIFSSQPWEALYLFQNPFVPLHIYQSVPSDGSNPFSVSFSHRPELWGHSTWWILMKWVSSAQLCLEEVGKQHCSSYQPIQCIKRKQTGAQTNLTLSPLIFVG